MLEINSLATYVTEENLADIVTHMKEKIQKKWNYIAYMRFSTTNTPIPIHAGQKITKIAIETTASSANYTLNEIVSNTP